MQKVLSWLGSAITLHWVTIYVEVNLLLTLWGKCFFSPWLQSRPPLSSEGLVSTRMCLVTPCNLMILCDFVILCHIVPCDTTYGFMCHRDLTQLWYNTLLCHTARLHMKPCDSTWFNLCIVIYDFLWCHAVPHNNAWFVWYCMIACDFT